MTRKFIWCTYRDWSFNMLRGLLDVEGWQPALIVTTLDCRYDFADFEASGIEILRDDPRRTLAPGGRGHQRIVELQPHAVFHNGWSWIVPDALLALCPNVTQHPGKLPKDRGGSPIQNQIRNGETWTYANVMKLSAQLDAGPVYEREKISLAGTADDVWARMTATGVVLSRRFLGNLTNPAYEAKPQADARPTFYKRVTSDQAELRPQDQTAVQMHDIIRAHSETDPNSYVKAAYFKYGEHELVIERSSLGHPETADVVLNSTLGLEVHGLASDVDNGERSVCLMDATGDAVRLDRLWVR
jgi:methionyl-tRNA formyltransferase